MKISMVPKNSPNEFAELINNYEQKIIQPVIDEILTNFEQDPNKFTTSEAAWERLEMLKDKLTANYQILEELTTSKSIKSDKYTLFIDEISGFVIQSENDLEQIYEYKKIIQDIKTKSSLLLEFREEQSAAYKPVHFIFAFVDDALKLEQLTAKYNLNLSEKTTHGSAAIHFAAQCNNQQGIKVLLDKYGINVNDRDEDNWSAVHYAVVFGHAELTTKLLNYDIHLNSQYSEDRGLIHTTIVRQWPKITKILLSSNKINFPIADILKIFQHEVSRNHNLSIKILLDYLIKQEEFEINRCYWSGFGPLHLAVINNNEQIARLLVEEYGADINLFLANNLNPLGIAMLKNNNYIVKYLLEQGAKLKCLIGILVKQPLVDNLFEVIAHFKFFASCDKKSHGIFYNKANIIGLIKNWPVFDSSLKKISTDQQDQDIIDINKTKLVELEQIVENITEFLCNRQANLEKPATKLSLLTNYFVKYFTAQIDWQDLKNNLYYKAVINEIMSGDIKLQDEKDNTSSAKIIDELKKYVMVILLHESKLINKNLCYLGEFNNLSYPKMSGNIKRSYNPFSKLALKNYQAIKQWKNDNFFKIIGVIKDRLELNDYTDNTAKEGDEQTTLQTSETKEQRKIVKMIWESDGFLVLIANHLAPENYFKSIDNETQAPGDEIRSTLTGTVDIYDLGTLNF